ncbi:uncharacterized protein LOC127788464 isoform X2 [Diospyros lotus]|uniref:uncharacterized protein LOC127788464 isoform X2 n=1 Tax=Diospyros lotus TaxID=55363 RepID=UPI00225A7A92|nr:uncharacterized protein LOC127788464 isoform X2 [Diospyros lotus]
MAKSSATCSLVLFLLVASVMMMEVHGRMAIFDGIIRSLGNDYPFCTATAQACTTDADCPSIVEGHNCGCRENFYGYFCLYV